MFAREVAPGCLHAGLRNFRLPVHRWESEILLGKVTVHGNPHVELVAPLLIVLSNKRQHKKVMLL